MATTKETTKVEKTTETEKTYKYIAPISKEEQEPVRVCINGKWTIIQRGVEVEVSAPVYEVLMNKEKMEREALMRQIELQNMSKF